MSHDTCALGIFVEIWSKLLHDILGTRREERRLTDDLRLIDHMGETIIAIDDIPC